MIIFPLLANVSAFSSSTTGAFVGVASNENVNSISSIRLKVDIPCSGHAPLISQELKSINGVVGVQFSFPNIFDVEYDSTKTSKQQILSLDVFKTYKATVLESTTQRILNNLITSQVAVVEVVVGVVDVVVEAGDVN
jgi:copper chaperone CopZ